MMNAIAYGHKEVVKILLNFGYTVDTVVKRGKMLLEWAIEYGHLSLIEVIIINCVATYGRGKFTSAHQVCFIVCKWMFLLIL